METGPVVFLLATSMAILTWASPVELPVCDLEPLTAEDGVNVFYTTSQAASGCRSRGPTDPSLDVHVLFLRYSGQQIINLLFNVSVSAAEPSRKSLFVVNSNVVSFLTVTTQDPQLTFVAATGNVLVQGLRAETPRANLSSSSGEELLTWAKAAYGGVSTFAELEAPQKIHFRLGTESGSSADCVPEEGFSTEPYLEVEAASANIQGCPSSGQNPGKEAHILWLRQDAQDSSSLDVNLNIELKCKAGGPENMLPILLVLKGHPSLAWHIGPVFSSFKFVVSSNYDLKNFGSRQVPGEDLPDSKEGLIAAARNKEFAFVASYTEIPSAKSITLELVRQCEESAVPTTEPPAVTSLAFAEFVRINITDWRPWRCLDSGVKVTLAKDYLRGLFMNPLKVTDVSLQDRSCRATDNGTHFVLTSPLRECGTSLERDAIVKNQLAFSLDLLREEVLVPFECHLPEKVFLQLYSAPDYKLGLSTSVIEANQAAYVLARFRTSDPLAVLEIKDCSLEMPNGASSWLLISGDNPLSAKTKILDSFSTTVRHFSFAYKTGQESWAETPATIVCRVDLYSQLHGFRSDEVSLEVMLIPPNAPPDNVGLGLGTLLGITFGAFFIGVLLTAALWYIYMQTRPAASKMEPVPANPPASESSTTNHSIGSTQSTPRSTSSMA
ncbi:endoglin isoform X1 [Anolis sagrei]|uniref:endoglin isoform X1 n=1 Tax=Anolis sagrei TaxID=38937 RepID=UPI003522B7A7